MTRIIMNGCNGRMGQTITKLVSEDENAVIVAGVDTFDGIKNEYPVFTDIYDCNVEADVIIDFSNASAIDHLLTFCKEKKMPVVLCSTGLSKEQVEAVHAASKEVAVLKSGNMSLGINTVMKMLKGVSKLLSDAGYDIEIVEKHHNQKLDAPSGTALMLADTINEQLNSEMNYVYDRSTVRQKRDKKEIGISAVRGGTIVGDHTVIYAGPDEVIEITHRAYSRGVFGKGAIEAAKFLKGKTTGFYDMSDVIG